MKNILKKLRFFRNNKIVTPTPKQVLQNAVVVTCFSLMIGAFVWVVDMAAYGMLDLVMSIIC